MAETVGLDIGTTAVRAALVATSKGAPVLKRYGEVGLPPGAVVNGEIVDDGVVADAITRLFKQAKLPKKRVVVGMANQRVIVRQVLLPQQSEEELAQSLAFQAQEFIPIPIDEAVLDFVPLEDVVAADGAAQMSVLVIAAQKDMASELLEVVNKVGVKPLSFDLQAFALVRSLNLGSFNLDPNARVIVNIGASITQVIVSKGGSLRFLRIIPMGGQDFTRRLADDMSISREEAEELKKRIGVARSDAPPMEGDDGKAQAALTAQADILIEEIRSSIDFYVSQNPEGAMDRLYISGNGTRLSFLAARMMSALNMQLDTIRLLADGEGALHEDRRLGLDENQKKLIVPVLPIAAGLAMWGEV